MVEGPMKNCEAPPKSTVDLQAFFERVRNSPFLRGYADRVERFEDLPPLDRPELHALIERNFSLEDEPSGVFFAKTGGTLSNALIMPIDPEENHRQRRILAEVLNRRGIVGPRTVAVNLFNYKHLYRSAALVDEVLDYAGATSVGIGGITPDEYVVNFVRMFGANTIMGTPSRLARFATYVNEEDIDVRIPTVIFAGEALTEEREDILRTVLGAETIYGLYGAVEIGTWGTNDHNDSPHTYRILPEIAHVEVEDPDEDGFGNLLVTNVLKERFPVLRYRLGDVGRVFERDGAPHFEFRKRYRFNFRLCGEMLTELEFETVSASAEAWQLQLDHTPERVSRLTLLLVRTDMPAAGPVADQYAAAKRSELLAKLAADPLRLDTSAFETEVRVVGWNELATHPITTKTPLIVDRRGVL
mgnify:FL=1